MRLNIHKYIKFTGCIAALMGMAMLNGCKEDIDTSARYVFTEETIGSYLQKQPAYSEYVALLKQVNISDYSGSTVMQLMTARGNYTCFAPTNEAIHAYLDSLVVRGFITEPKWEAFTDSAVKDSIRQVIVYNSIIDGGDFTSTGERTYYETSTFPINNNEEFASPTLADRKLFVYYGENPDSIFINGNIPISLTNRDIPAINGVIHQVESVIAPSNDTGGYLLKSMIDENRKGFLVTAKLIQACGLMDTLSLARDERYETLYKNGTLKDLRTHPSVGKPGYLPEHRKYGYTLFAETDEFWEGVIGKPYDQITVEDIKEYVIAQGVYPDAKQDDNYKDEDNVLNQFITYHLIPWRLPADKLILHYNEKGYSLSTMKPTVAMTELYTTMGKRRLLKIFESAESQGIYLNRFPELRNGRRENYHESSCDDDKFGFRINVDSANTEAINMMIYPISHEKMPGRVLAYDEDTRNNLQRQRMRYDVSALFPEYMNNDVRGQTVTTDRHMCFCFPINTNYQYMSDIEMSDETEFYYLLGRGNGWHNYLHDEFNIVGRYDIIMRLPPVPKRGTYELRVAVQSHSQVRGMCQVYWGHDKDNLAAQGIPLDVRMGGQYRYTSAGNFKSTVGWVEDDEEDMDYNAEVDKRMRNNNRMKGAEAIANSGGSARKSSNSHIVRHILLRQHIDANKTYYLRLKSVLDSDRKELYMDHLEWCAKEVYDNPEQPEDIW